MKRRTRRHRERSYSLPEQNASEFTSGFANGQGIGLPWDRFAAQRGVFNTMAKLGNAFMSLFLDKRARETLKASKAAPAAAPAATPVATPPAARPEAHPSQEEINARLDEAVETRARNAASPGRQALIRNALRIRADKARMLDDLPEEQRRKLQAMAMMAMMKPPGRR